MRCTNSPWNHSCPLADDGARTCEQAEVYYLKQEQDEAYADSQASSRYEDAAYGRDD